jgi:2-keto-4-pentenoate hydratase/2-oxohepta-3-ene-1,7-dioic acid hydratase in catechol pathway
VRLATFLQNGRERWGAVLGDEVAPLDHAWPSLRAALGAGNPAIAAALAETKTRVPLAGLRLLPPIPDPEKIYCAGVNYKAHTGETGRENKEYPSMFMRFPDSQVGHDNPIVLPFLSETFDWESELAVIIGKRCRHVPKERAFDVIAGYSCFGDHTIREFTKHERQITPGKNFHHSGAFGPWLVTADEIPDPAALTMTGKLNGEVMQSTSTGDLIFDIPFLIWYLSQWSVLKPGDVIATGTPSGVGFTRKPPIWMKAGDTFEIEISSIGVLRNTVVPEERPAGYLLT